MIRFSTLKHTVCVLFCLSALSLTGCTVISEKSQISSPSLNVAMKVAPAWQISLDPISDEQQLWLEKLRRFDQDTSVEHKQTYLQNVKRLQDWPEDTFCSEDHGRLIQQTLQLNPTSMIGYSVQHYCASLVNDEATMEQALTAIQRLSDLMFSTGNGTTPEDPIRVRYPHEAQLLFNWSGFEVFDIEMTEFKNQVQFKLHCFRYSDYQYASFYVSNTDYMLYQLQTPVSSERPESDKLRALTQYYLQQEHPAAQLWNWKRQLLQHQYQDVTEQLSAIQDLSPMQTVLLAEAALGLKDQALLESQLDAIIAYSEQQFVDASAILGQYLLAMNDSQSHIDAANLFKVNVEHNGSYYSAESWLWSFLSQPEPQTLLKTLLGGLDESQVRTWYHQVIDFTYYHTGLPYSPVDKLPSLLKTLADTGLDDAQVDYGYLLLEGRWNAEANVSQGIAYFKELAEQGASHAQLEYGLLFTADKYGVAVNRDTANYWYRKAAEQGNVSALYNLGLAYRFARGVEKDLDLSLDYFQRSFDNGFAMAACRIGDIFSEEPDLLDLDKAFLSYRTVAEDEQANSNARAVCALELGQLLYYEKKQPQEAIPWWTLAGELGDSEGFFELGYFYSDGPESERDFAKAIDYYEQAVRMGNYRAAANLGYMYEVGEGTSIDVKMALQYYQFSASGDSAQGINNYATFYRYGTAVEKDVETALSLYMKAYVMGNDYAANNIADMYYFGELGAPDYVRACDYYEAALERKFESAIYDIGYCYFYGEGRKQDVRKGLALFEEGARSGNRDALNELGEIYMFGRGLEESMPKALDYLRLAYARQSSEAAYNLGLAHENGMGVQADSVMALVYYEQSAKWGNVEGMLAAAKSYLWGVGTRKNLTQAKYWLDAAIEKGSSEAKDLLKQL